jgi:hydrogenase maturation protease
VSERKSALLLGVGNILWADEGFGVRCVEAFAQRFDIPDNVVVTDGGTQGLYLVELLRAHNPVIIFDAVDFGDTPATMRLVENDDIPAFVGAHKMSLHQAGLQDVIACAKLLGDCADNMLLIGVQPVELEDYGGSLRPQVRDCIPRALDIAAQYLADFGIQLTARSDSPPPGLITPGLELASYESGRPDASIACRQGDERVLNRSHGD